MTDKNEPQIYGKRYKIERKLGAGNFGTAYLVTDLKARKEPKVLKVVRLGEMNDDESADAVREAELLARLDNEYIVKLYESFLENDCLCMVTEYCDGGDLDQRLKEAKKQNQSLTEDQVVEWLIQILIAVQYMHKSRILHRDLKARNIFLKNNKVKIGDFGISRVLIGTMDVATTFTGTPYYMSPEVMKHSGYKDKSDIWSVGCLLYEMCTFKHAFDGKGLMNVIYQVVEGKPPQLPNNYSKELNDILKKMFNKDPERRPSAEDILRSKFIVVHCEQKRLNNPLENTINGRSRLHEINNSFQSISSYGAMKNGNWNCHGKAYGVDEDPEERSFDQISSKTEDEPEFEERTLVAPDSKKSGFDNNNTVRVTPRGVAMEISVKPERNQRVDNAPKPKTTRNEDFSERPISPMKKSYQQIAQEHGADEESYERAASPTRASTPNRSRYGTTTSTRAMSASQQTTINSMSQTIIPRTKVKKNSQEMATVGPARPLPRNQDQPMRPVVSKVKGPTHDSPILDPYGPQVKQQKIDSLRIRAIQYLGDETFEKVYDYFVRQRTIQKTNPNLDDQQIAEGLRSIVPRADNCFLVDQLVFLEML